jgi:heterodisulfide reductase subunit A-like polyferredoxin
MQNAIPTVKVNANMCSGCGICNSSCHYGAAYLRDTGGKITSDTDMFRCKACGMCVSACPADARELLGSDMESLISKVMASL